MLDNYTENVVYYIGKHQKHALLTDFPVYTGPISDRIFVEVFDICKDGYNPALLCIWLRKNIVIVLKLFIF